MNAPANIQSRVQDYLDERRRLGFQLKSSGPTLMNFAQFVDALDQAGPLTSDVMIEWARQDKQGCHGPETWARRFKLLRPFARYLQQFEPATAIPDEAVFGPIPGWLMPHIYRDHEVVDLLAAAFPGGRARGDRWIPGGDPPPRPPRLLRCPRSRRAARGTAGSDRRGRRPRCR